MQTDRRTPLLQVGSFNYPEKKMVFRDEFIADEKQIRSVLDYNVGINELSKAEKRYTAITGKTGHSTCCTSNPIPFPECRFS